jgi:hypothetical protein
MEKTEISPPPQRPSLLLASQQAQPFLFLNPWNIALGVPVDQF